MELAVELAVTGQENIGGIIGEIPKDFGDNIGDA